MADDPTKPDLDLGELPLSLLDRVDRACDRFEDAWAAGGRPSIESSLADAPEGDGPELFRRLLDLELGLRIKAGESPDAGPYRDRFPGREGAIDSAFAEAAGPGPEGDEGPETLLGVLEPDASDSDRLSSDVCLPPTLGPHSGTAADVRDEPLPVGTIFGDYELLEPIGQGGMGIVYRAWQRGAARQVALKLIQPRWLARLPPEHAAEAVAMFLAEARVAAGLHHENLVTVFDVGEADGRPYYSMRYIEGRSLAGILRDGPLADDRAIGLLEPVARAVDHAHRQKVLHRDLKPANILVDEQGTPFVADFGLAKLLEAPAVPGPDRAGTPSYMSPEQARGLSTVGPASDVYGLGATLYDLLTGRPPFRAARSRETIRQVIHDDPAPPRELNPSIGADLEAVCLKCLKKDPRHRYPDAGRLAADLRRCRDRQSTEARPEGPVARAGRWASRRPSRVAALAAATALLVGLSARVYRDESDLHDLAVLAARAPDGAPDADLQALASAKAEAAIALARRGRGETARALLRMGPDPRLHRALLARLRREPDAIRRALESLEVPGAIPGHSKWARLAPGGRDGYPGEDRADPRGVPKR